MWELPNVARSRSLGEAESALAQRYGGRWKLSQDASELRHAITHRAITVHAHAARFEAGESVAEGPEAAWADAAARARLPTSSMVEKVLAEVTPRGR
jgi:adenine-specific DNA glycosylase